MSRILALSVAAWVIIVGASLLLTPQQQRSAPPVPACAASAKSVVDLTVELLRCDPDGWSGDRFSLEHRSGISIWVANDDWGLTVSKSGGVWHSGGAYEATDDKRRVWAAYQDWSARRIAKP